MGNIKLFLTSSPGGSYKKDGRRFPCELDNTNSFVDQLKSDWKEKTKVCIISGDPDNFERNDSIREQFAQAFPMSGLPVVEMVTCDHRKDHEILRHLSSFDCVILSGGHVPTQNVYMKEIFLTDKLEKWDGIVIGISAGTMNLADLVYAQPELPGESMDPDYERFLTGLGLTDLMILPHYQELKDDILDGKRVMEDITYPDSMGRTFYALVDGSYVLIQNGERRLFGEGYRLSDGEIVQISKENEVISI